MLNSNEEIAFVLEEFEGPIYDYLHSLKKTIFGPTLVHQLAARGLPPKPCERPLFNLSMEDVSRHMFQPNQPKIQVRDQEIFLVD